MLIITVNFSHHAQQPFLHSMFKGIALKRCFASNLPCFVPCFRERWIEVIVDGECLPVRGFVWHFVMQSLLTIRHLPGALPAKVALTLGASHIIAPSIFLPASLAVRTTFEVDVNLVLIEPFYENIICLFVFHSPFECIIVSKSLQHLSIVLVCLVQRGF